MSALVAVKAAISRKKATGSDGQASVKLSFWRNPLFDIDHQSLFACDPCTVTHQVGKVDDGLFIGAKQKPRLLRHFR